MTERKNDRKRERREKKEERGAKKEREREAGNGARECETDRGETMRKTVRRSVTQGERESARKVDF